MTDLFDEGEGATPLDPDEREGLKVSWVTFRRNLNQVEQDNIRTATVKAMRSPAPNLLSEDYLTDLHRQMFGDVWTWAGKYRTTAKNIGVDAVQIQIELRRLLDDVKFWLENKTWAPDEIAIRFHHRLVQIHPWPNGNGRWARLAADLLIRQLGGERFTWGRKSLGPSGKARRAYIAALREADGHDMESLIAFSRS